MHDERYKGPVTGRLDPAHPVSLALPPLPAVAVRTDRAHLTLHRLPCPAWASAMGRDRHGLWAEFSLTPGGADPAPPRRRWWSRKPAPGREPQPAPVIQRLRWIPPGRFLMGSPADEPGRWEDEGPRHPVTIPRGFWLFDTPCTQALWTAVMGANPSRFQDPRRPVERVSWDESQGFIARINAALPGLELILPTEAQWEHACRAGTETALYTGPIEILGQHHAPALDPIAWYGGNSGVRYDLAEAHDTTGDYWKDMQYQTKRAGTRQVKGKQPNPWGLYDMLGNVWEWVADPWHEDYRGAPEDGASWDNAGSGSGSRSRSGSGSGSGPGAARVVRGGSWGVHARRCRCASRDRLAPADRLDALGFRCARVQES